MAPIRTIILVCSVLLPSCSSGGNEEDRPISEVLIAASHNMFAFGGVRGFTEFPVPKSRVGTDRGLFTMTDTAGYTVQRQGSGVGPPQRYELAKDGSLSLTVPVSNAAPTRFLGAYQQSAPGDKTQVFFFTDRFAPTNNPSVALFWGTRTVTNGQGPVGDWFLFSQHVVFTKSNVLNPHDVGRSVAGVVTIKANADPTKPDVLTGTGDESSGATLTFTGTATRFADGALTLGIDYRNKTNSDDRVFRTGLAKDVILGVDEDESNGETGLIALVRMFTFADLGAAQVKLSGTFQFGMHTVFVAPTNSGIDAANGTIVFNNKGGWQLDGIGSQGPGAGAFSYSGSYSFEEVTPKTTPVTYTNRLVLKVSGSNETWFAAVDLGYEVLLLVDNEVEKRTSGNSPELNLALGIRVVEPAK